MVNLHRLTTAAACDAESSVGVSAEVEATAAAREAPTAVLDARSCAPVRRAAAAASSRASPRTRRPERRTNSAQRLALGRLPCDQRLTLVHFTAQSKRFLWDRGCG
jgi:hypothetical protein